MRAPPLSFSLFAAVLASSIGCSSADAPAGEAPRVETSAAEPSLACPVATRPSAEDGSCIPVGPSMDAVAGFTRDAVGWGYDAVLPDHECTGATIALLGQRECQPIDDCTAAFPPAGADIVLDPKTAAPESRATLLQDAVTRVRKGGTIALEAGDYDPITIIKDVRIVGRCASKVRIRSKNPVKPSAPGEDVGVRDRGVDVFKAVNVELASLEIEGFEFGVYTDQPPAKVKLDRMLFSGNRTAVVGNFGVTVEMTRSVSQGSADFPRNDASGPMFHYGSKATLSEVDIRGMDSAITAMSPKTDVLLKRSVVGYAYKPVYRGCGVQSFRGANVRIEESFVSARAGFAIEVGQFLGDPPERDKKAGAGSLEVKRSVLLHDGKANADVAVHEGILNVWDGGRIDLEDTTVKHRSLSALAVMSGSTLTARKTAFLDDESFSLNREAIAIWDNAKADLEDSVVVDAQQIGILLRDRGAALAMRRSLVTGTKHRVDADFSDLGGSGQAISAGPETHVDVADSALVGNEGIALLGLDGATIQLDHALVDDTRTTPDGRFGVGILVIASQLGLSSSRVRRSADTAVAFDGSAAIVSSSWFTDNQVAIRAAGGTRKIDAEVAPTDFKPNEALFFGVRFDRNATPFSTASIAFP